MKKTETVESLRECILRESEFRTVANESVYDLQIDSDVAAEWQATKNYRKSS